MTDHPVVACIMLTKDRPLLARRAVELFRAQTYRNKFLIVADSGDVSWWPTVRIPNEKFACGFNCDSIGTLRNAANNYATYALPTNPELFAHWDDDDWSDPGRLEEQIDVLERFPENDVVGYSRMAFWREPSRCICGADEGKRSQCPGEHPGEAWVYHNPVTPPGSSFVYRVSAWEARRFPDTSDGEDTQWVMPLNLRCMANLHPIRMVARIHAGNAHRTVYRREVMQANEKQGGEWMRAPGLDGFCAEVMSLGEHPGRLTI